MKYKVILNIFIADKLLKSGFIPVEFTPSKKVRGKAAFVFEDTQEFQEALKRLSNN